MLVMTLIALADVSTDYDHNVDFSKYKTYSWVHEPNVADPLMRQRVEDAVNRELQQKGLTLVTSPERADLGVVVNGATKEKHNLRTFYDGWPGGWFWGGWGTATTEEEDYTVGTLVVDLFDMNSERIVWRGVGTDTLSEKPAKNEKKIERITEKMFEHFPKRLT
jgi:hypothetical protein